MAEKYEPTEAEAIALRAVAELWPRDGEQDAASRRLLESVHNAFAKAANTRHLDAGHLGIRLHETLCLEIRPALFNGYKHVTVAFSDGKWVATAVRSSATADPELKPFHLDAGVTLSYDAASGRIESNQPDPRDEHRSRTPVAILVELAAKALADLRTR